ncbi:MAG TPA: oxidoreductase [Jatrophihabitans sp.]|nr:oxidoreductase [Jatrophihabitans sp.]
MAWRAAQLADLTGRRAVVTGANSGIGFHTALELARAGAQVTLACRRAEAAHQAAGRIRAQVPGAQVELGRLDLASQQSVATFAAGWSGPLHLLVNNAGVMAPRHWQQTRDGYELQFGANHLGHFALTGRLLPALIAAGDARVVTVASLAHRGGGPDVVAGNPPQDYSPQRAYSNSKLANLLFALELQRRASGGLTSAAAHPGLSNTNLFKGPEGMGANPVIRIGGRLVGPLFLQTAAAGALPTLYAATVAEPGSYTGPQWPGEVRGAPGPARVSALAANPELAGQLWDLSEELTGVAFRFD